MLLQLSVALVKTSQRVTDNLPVYQVLRMQDGQPGHTLETGGRHVIIFSAGTHANIGVGVVGIDNGISVRAVAIVGRPYL